MGMVRSLGSVPRLWAEPVLGTVSQDFDAPKAMHPMGCQEP